MNKIKLSNVILEKLLNKRGEISLPTNDESGSTNEESNTKVQEAINVLTKKVDAIISSFSKTDGKNVDENIKNEIIAEVQKVYGGRNQDDVKLIENLTKELETAKTQNRAYALEKELKVIGDKVGINKDGMDLFSQLVKPEQAYDEKGNIKNDFLEGEAKNFIKKYGVFSVKQKKDFGVSYLDYVGKEDKQNTIDRSKLSTSQRLAMFYSE